MFNRIFNRTFQRKKIIFLAFLLFLTFISNNNSAFASETNGTIDSTFKYAWGENTGWINFGCDNCGVSVTDTSISGYAWSSQFGWINLNPTLSGITNNGEGTLSGFAWSSNLGWIDFGGVTINTSGEFLGYATVRSNSSQISFNCINGNSCGNADFKVKTDWRPASVRSSGSPGGGSSGYYRPIPPPVTLAILPPVITSPNPVVKVIDKIVNFFKPKIPKIPPTIVSVPKTAPLSLRALWNLSSAASIRSFVFAPLPYEVRILATKFPELGRTLQSVGIKRLTDMSKLTGVSLNLPSLSLLTNTLRGVGVERLADLDKLKSVSLDLPGISTIDQKIIGSVGIGKIALIQGLLLAKFPLIAKRNLPTEFVFARTAGERLDLNVALSLGEKGQVTQTISSLPGQRLKLVVKPISPASSVTGYFIFKSATPKVVQTQISRSSLLASALFSMNDLVEQNPKPISVENKFVLFSFEYTDPDRDGIYTADVVSPVVPGVYEIITVINYKDPVLGTRQMRLITVIDPEGYIFEKNNGKETRIPGAIVSLYTLNTTTKKYELWEAKEYSQENPQITDVRGTYSFLVPEGFYYFEVITPGYNTYQGKIFTVTTGDSIHQNIELKSTKEWLFGLDWTTILLIVVSLLLVYNLYRNNLRDKLLKSLAKK